MKKKTFIILLIATLCFSFFAAAENVGDRKDDLSRMAVEMEMWSQELEEAFSANQDTDVALILKYASEIIRITQECVLKDVENPVNEIQFDGLEIEPEYGVVDGNAYYIAALHLLEGSGAYAAADVVYREGFLLARYSLYDVDGYYLATVRVETAKRENDWMILIVDYDHLDDTTGRFALKITEGKPEVIYTKTLGMNLYTVLDVSAWHQGVDFGAWNKQLLLPVHY